MPEMPAFRIPGRMSPLEWLKSLLGDPLQAERKFTVPLGDARSMTFDARRGIGETPNSRNIAYMGATVLMSPEEYLGLAARIPQGAPLNPYVVDALQQGQSMSPAQLYLRGSAGSQDPWTISGHEGRNRMSWLRDQGYGDLPVPVQLLPAGESFRSRHVTPELLRQMFNPVRSERGPLETLARPGAAAVGDQFMDYAQGGYV